MADSRLEPLAEKHLPSVAAMFDDEDVLRYTRIPDPAPSGFEREWLEFYEEGRREGKREAFAVVDADDGSFLGLALAFGIDREGQQLELGYVVAPQARGRGVATRALELLTDWALKELDALRIELWISASNDASKRVATNAGYRYEGTLRSYHFKQGRREDFEIWSRLASD
ncbi:MAG TPA: GNAT family protein [Gaiellaceae bacterium]|nr:GNAT family protein [Gaiellaceae bacterium]